MSTSTVGHNVDAISDQLDRDIEALERGAAAWAIMTLSERAALFKRTHQAVAVAAGEWAETAIRAKRTPAGPPEGEEWISGPWAALSGLTAVIETLEKLAAGKSPLDGIKAKVVPGGRVSFRMLPANLYELSLFNGFSADLWLRPGVTAADARARAGLGANRIGHNGGVGLVLGAGNISAIGPLDVLYQLVAFNRASILKLNPTFASLIGPYQKAFKPLIDAGVLRIVNGAAEVGAFLTGHPGIDHVHITGSALTHDLIVWGSATKKKTGKPKLDKPISSELGGVSPVIVIPGDWSEADLRFQAENVATQRLNNSGHNCIATQALILSADWRQKDRFVEMLRDVLDELPARAPWYPGSDRRIAAAEASYPGAEHLNGRVLVEVSDEASQDLYTTEYFAPVLGYTELTGTGSDFFSAAVEFANKRLYGTLGATVVVSPASRKSMGGRFNQILGDLHYGTIGVNVWSAIGFLVPALSWGAFPGNTLEDVGSGIGIVHNSRLVDDVERSVLSGPFRPFPRSVLSGELALSPKPAWFVTARSAQDTAQALTEFAAGPSWLKLTRVFSHAFRA